MFEYSPEIQEKITIAIYSIVASGIVSFAIGYYLGKKNIKYQEKLRAKKEFRDAFAPILIELDEIRDIRTQGYSQGDFPSDIVEKHFNNLETAKTNFAGYLDKRDKIKFIKVWDEFAYPNKGLSIAVSDNDLNKVPSPEYFSTYQPEIVEIRKKLRAKINNILAFAKFE
ncbi:MAG: hypothetical protein KKF62_01790 [Bacteroidetes bacterium]|nr:hypothetical protein [Bacteroidota bacterium]MBU1116336.1 hypothetical protein [Bacteroidota bacterium]MBU1796909.1 hypothetical protein [Bacteroidota bacterium]